MICYVCVFLTCVCCVSSFRTCSYVGVLCLRACFQSLHFAYIIKLLIELLDFLSTKGKYFRRNHRGGSFWVQKGWIKCLKTVCGVFQSCVVMGRIVRARTWNLSWKYFCDKMWFCTLQQSLAWCLQYDSLKTFCLIYCMTSARKGVQLWENI